MASHLPPGGARPNGRSAAGDGDGLPLAHLRDGQQLASRPIDPALQSAQQPVLEDLVRAGFDIASVQDLYRHKHNYRTAIPVLLRWLPRVEHPIVKEMIVRALSVRWARPIAAPALVEEFRRAPDHPVSSLKWVVGNALSVVADDSVLDSIAELLRDPQHGKAREMLAEAMANMRDPRAVDLLIESLSDPQVAGHAIVAMQKLAPGKARPHIEPFLFDSRAWVRNSAKRALAKIDKARQA